MNIPTGPDQGRFDLIRKGEDPVEGEVDESIEQAHVVMRSEQVPPFGSNPMQQPKARVEMLSYYTLSRRHT